MMFLIHFQFYASTTRLFSSSRLTPVPGYAFNGESPGELPVKIDLRLFIGSVNTTKYLRKRIIVASVLQIRFIKLG